MPRARDEQGAPREEPQGTPRVRDLHDTSDIRFVMVELGRLTERLDVLTSAIEKQSAAFEKASEKQTADFKERFVEVRSDAKEVRDKLHEVDKSIATFKGGLKIIHLLYAAGLVLMSVFLAWYLRPAPQPATLQAVSPASEAPDQKTEAAEATSTRAR